MIERDLHTHTIYCDGLSTPEEMVVAAIDAGLKEIGISGHSYTYFDDSFCMSLEGTEQYCREIRALKEKYKDQINVRLGIEYDYYSEFDASAFDYIIGSVHYVKCAKQEDAIDGVVIYGDDAYISVDWTAETTLAAIDRYYGGDSDALAEAYFEVVADIYRKTRCDIVGHFDLLTKFNEQVPVFDMSSERYVVAYKKAVDRIIADGCKLFEINTGAITRGYRTTPYPSEDIREYIRSKGGEFIYSSDSHDAETIGRSLALATQSAHVISPDGLLQMR